MILSSLRHVQHRHHQAPRTAEVAAERVTWRGQLLGCEHFTPAGSAGPFSNPAFPGGETEAQKPPEVHRE